MKATIDSVRDGWINTSFKTIEGEDLNIYFDGGHIVLHGGGDNAQTLFSGPASMFVITIEPDQDTEA